MGSEATWSVAAASADPIPLARLVEGRVRDYFQRRAEHGRRDDVVITRSGPRIGVRSMGWDRWQVHLTVSLGLVEIYRWPSGTRTVIVAADPEAAAQLDDGLSRIGPAPAPHWEGDSPEDLLQEIRWLDVAVDDLVRDYFGNRAGVDARDGALHVGSVPEGEFLEVVIRPSGHVVWVAHRHGRRAHRIVTSEWVRIAAPYELVRQRLLPAIRPRRVAACRRPDRRKPSSSIANE